MENFKTKAFSKTFEFVTEIETEIPKELVEKLQELFNKFETENFIMTPLMTKIDGSLVYFGVLKKETDGEGLKYQITISKKEIA